MPSPALPPATYASTAFVESAGAVLFRRSTSQICILHHKRRNEYLLSKGRRDIHESRHEAAVREVEEETGYKCRLLQIAMWSWQTTSEDDDAGTGRRAPRDYLGLVREPFMFQLRMFRADVVKIIWWFVGAVNEDAEKADGEPWFDVDWYEFDKAVEVLTFESDREVVREAIDLYRSTFDKADAGREVV